jgi:hypothetical protein
MTDQPKPTWSLVKFESAGQYDGAGFFFLDFRYGAGEEYVTRSMVLHDLMTVEDLKYHFSNTRGLGRFAWETMAHDRKKYICCD